MASVFKSIVPELRPTVLRKIMIVYLWLPKLMFIPKPASFYYIVLFSLTFLKTSEIFFHIFEHVEN